MNLKTFGLTATTIAASVALASSPAQAATITSSGGFIINGQTSITNPSTNAPILNFSNFKITPSTPYGGLSGLSGTPTIKSLQMFGGPLDPSVYENEAKTDFITGLFLDGAPLAFDLDASGVSLFGTIKGVNDFFLAGPITGTFRTGNTVAGFGAISSVNLEGGDISSISLVAQAVPTPALLPGLIAMGIGMVRKRKAEAEAVGTES
jgi:hypothetical protein